MRIWQLVSCIVAVAGLSALLSHRVRSRDVCAPLASAQASLPRLVYLKGEHALSRARVSERYGLFLPISYPNAGGA